VYVHRFTAFSIYTGSNRSESAQTTYRHYEFGGEGISKLVKGDPPGTSGKETGKKEQKEQQM